MSNTDTGRGRTQTLVGIVVGDKMDKTVTVQVEHTVVHRLYQRYARKTRKYAAHDENNACKVGDRVIVASMRPMSKNKRWRVREILDRGEER